MWDSAVRSLFSTQSSDAVQRSTMYIQPGTLSGTIGGNAWTTVLLLTIVGSACVALAQWARKVWAMRSFSGPKPIPFLGNILAIVSAKSVILYLKRMQEVHGRMFSLWIFNAPKVVCMHPKAARQVLADSKRVDKPDAYQKTLATILGQGLVTSSGELHKRDKACLGRFFTRSSVEQFVPTIQKCVDDGIERYAAALEGRTGNVMQLFHVTTLRVATLLIGSHDVWNDIGTAEQTAAEVSHASNTIGEHMIYGIPMWQVFPKVRRLRRAVAGTPGQSMLRTPLERRKKLIESGATDIPNDPLAAMMREGMSEKRIGDQILTLISAGHDTTSFLLGYCCFCLAQHRDVQDRVREEIARVIGHKNSIERGDLDRLVYLQQVIQETLRLYAVVPMVLRVAKREVHLDATNQTIPAGTEIIIPFGHINRDPAIWDDPATFNPSRMAGVPIPSAKHGFFPFAYGERACVGNVLAIIEAKMFLVRLLQKYRITGDPKFRPKILAGMTLVSDNIEVSFDRCPLPAI